MCNKIIRERDIIPNLYVDFNGKILYNTRKSKERRLYV